MSDSNKTRRSSNSASESRRAGQGGSRSGSGEAHRSMPRRRTRKRPLGVTILVRFFQVLGTLLLIGLVTGSFLVCYAAFYVKTSVMPHTQLDLSAYTLSENSKIYYTDKDTGLYVEMLTLVGNKDSEWVDLKDIPEDLQNAVVAIEDKSFWTHRGVNWKRTGGAVLNMFLGMKDTFGGSTITQQLIKNVTQYDDVTVTRKITEIFTALELEKNYSKEDILELYLNLIYLGDNCYGVQAAAQKYFGKDVSDLSLAECACLAGITNNPSLYGPNSDLRVTRYKCGVCEEYTNNSKPDECPDCGAKDSFGEPEIWTARDYNKHRQLIILGEMLDKDGENGVSYITQAEYDAAVKEELNFLDSNDDEDEDEEESAEPSRYSWYVETVLDEVADDLQAQTGLDRKAVNQLLYSGGLSIYTNFDPDVQAKVDEVYGDADALGGKTDAKGRPLKSAITVVDNATGNVVALAGDIGTKTVTLGNNYATMPHQPGSSFKPLSVYAPALEMGLVTPATTIDDAPVQLMNGSVWPRNDGASYKGLMSVQQGVMSSLNTIAVRTLQLVTPEASFQFLEERFGITTLEEGRQNKKGEWLTDIGYSPLALGGLTDGISTFEAAGAFATFPRNGLYTKPTTYSRVEDRNHQVLIDNTQTPVQVIKESTAYYMNTMLTNAVQSGTGTPAKISGMTVAGKTGTTNNSYARWFSGYTPYYTASVWVGYQYDYEISGFSKNPAVQLWQKVMAGIHEGLDNTSFPKTVETVSRRVCTDCGNLATEACEGDIRGDRVKSFEFVKGDEPQESCTCHVAVTVCTGASGQPIVDEEGNVTGTEEVVYYEPGPWCPEETCKTFYLVDYTRDSLGASVGDAGALLSNFQVAGTCPIHTEDWVDPNAEPTDDPDALSSDQPPGSESPGLPIESGWPGLPTQDPDNPVTPPLVEPTPDVFPSPQETPAEPAQTEEPVYGPDPLDPSPAEQP